MDAYFWILHAFKERSHSDKSDVVVPHDSVRDRPAGWLEGIFER